MSGVVSYYIVGYRLFIDFYELDFGNYICKVLSEIGEILQLAILLVFISKIK